MDLLKESRLPADIIGELSVRENEVGPGCDSTKLLCVGNYLQKNWIRGHRCIGMSFTGAMETLFSKPGTGLNKSLNKS